MDLELVKSSIDKMASFPGKKAEEEGFYKEGYIDDVATSLLASVVTSREVILASVGEGSMREMARKAYRFAQIAWEEKLRSNPDEFKDRH